MSKERKPPERLIVTSHGDRRTRPVGKEGKRANWAQLWLMAMVNRWVGQGISQEEIEQRLARLLPQRPQKLTGTMTPAQMEAIQQEDKPGGRGQKPLVFQGTFFDGDGQVVGAADPHGDVPVDQLEESSSPVEPLETGSASLQQSRFWWEEDL